MVYAFTFFIFIVGQHQWVAIDGAPTFDNVDTCQEALRAALDDDSIDVKKGTYISCIALPSN
jgi:hypothetical protein